jgi:hypothetical protein
MNVLLLLLTLISTVLAYPFRITSKSDDRIHQLATQAQQTLTAFHGTEPDNLKIKKCEITISNEGFLRHRRTYASGKQEYYSLNLSRLQSLDFYGNTSVGRLTILTLEDDVIVQTYNDRQGNVDSMAVRFDLQVGAVEPEDVVMLQRDLLEIKSLVKL